MDRQVNVRVSENEYKALEEISLREERKISQTIRLFIRRYMPAELARVREAQKTLKTHLAEL